ncbi:YbfB/YjiJ family MFS transporter [Paenibacillus sp. H1-7]|uniref:YbfB/YjiJ family MFS transporter n=1 Tax=Paenibacillus sp. H1-7 TaxID=2282849 RepID=UPI001EF7FA1C|nr:YbfB/YjiJ family MFS transporter [Paenibacillus sp. H1-7]ULL14022.1 YbfB/YjiJ family MFS transporter [Paenibacillus sp. H1-7]
MSRHPLVQVTGGICALLLAMGIGRFAYTPILPLMQQDQLISDAASGYLASSNYAGYLLGALLAGWIPWKTHKTSCYRASLAASVLSTVLMGLTASYAAWFVLRFVSGAASAFVFVLASSMVLDGLAAKGKTAWSGILYGGVGFGILASGLLVPLFDGLWGWRGAWLGLGAFSGLIAVFAWRWVDEEARREPAAAASPARLTAPPARWIPWLIAAYGMEGLGYIVTGTFIVAIADKLPGMAGHSAWVWTLVGLAAAPSCIVWSFFAAKKGFVRILGAAMLVQAIGIVLPAIWPTTAGISISAVLFGATFMGITALATTLARQINPTQSSRIIGILTAVYGAGQMLGPSGAGLLFHMTHQYNSALIGAGVIVLAGACLLSTGFSYDKKRGNYDAVR